MKSDSELQHEIKDALTRAPDLPAEAIEVRVLDGFVTLTGTVGSDVEKWNAEEVVRSVQHVAGLSDEILVFPKAPGQELDGDIARSWFP